MSEMNFWHVFWHVMILIYVFIIQWNLFDIAKVLREIRDRLDK